LFIKKGIFLLNNYNSWVGYETENKAMIELKDLVIGRKYRVKSQEWFDDNKNHNSSGHAGEEMILNEIVNRRELVLYASWKRDDGYVWLDVECVDEISGQPKPSNEVLDIIKRLNEEGYIYGYSGGPGGGGGGAMNTVGGKVLPVIKEDGSSAVFMPVNELKRIFEVEKMNELFDTGRTEVGFQATKDSYIRTELKLIEDKAKLLKRTSWSSYHSLR